MLRMLKKNAVISCVLCRFITVLFPMLWSLLWALDGYLYEILSETFLILQGNELDIIKMYKALHVQ